MQGIFNYIGYIPFTLFYGSYLAKMLLQRKQGIQTSQLGKSRENKNTMKKEKCLAFFTSLLVIIQALEPLLPDSWIGFYDWKLLQKPFLKLIGLIVSLTGCFLFILAMSTMKDSWRAGVAEKEETKLVTKGIYSISRNPAFLGFDIFYIGYMLLTGDILVMVVSLITIWKLHGQILLEESIMEKKFGNAYKEYRKKVRRYL